MQLTTDGHRPYLQAIKGAFGCEVDYATLVKIYGNPPDDRRYSPGCIGCETQTITGSPDPEQSSTSSIERLNLTMPVIFHNFARIYKTLRTSLAQAAGITDKFLEIEDIVKLLD